MRTENSAQEQVNKNIWIDMDETLIHTCFSESEVPPVEDLAAEPVQVDFEGRNHHKVIVRPGAHKLLFELRSIGHVFMITRASKAWALVVNKTFNFGFTENRIYGRRDVDRSALQRAPLAPRKELSY